MILIRKLIDFLLRRLREHFGASRAGPGRPDGWILVGGPIPYQKPMILIRQLIDFLLWRFREHFGAPWGQLRNFSEAFWARACWGRLAACVSTAGTESVKTIT